MDWKRALCVPSYLAALVPVAAGGDDWYTFFVCQRGSFGMLSWHVNVWVPGVILGVAIGAATIAATIASIRRPSYGWVPPLALGYLLWFMLGLPAVWRA